MRFHLRSPKDDGVDRPDLDAPQGVKATGTNRPKQTHQTQTTIRVWRNNTNNKATDTSLSLASTTQYLTQHQQPEYALSVCRWPIAAGKRPDPFRTRKLSLPALMVLQPGGCGRVRNRRHQTTNTQLNTTKKGETVETPPVSTVSSFSVFHHPCTPQALTGRKDPSLTVQT